MITAQHPQSIQAEAYREPRTNGQFIQLIGDMESLVVTSSLIGEEKTSSAINLAHVLAHAGERVLLIDADLRRPSVAEHLDLESTAGLTSVLIEKARLEDVTQPLEKDGLDVLASGPVPLNPSELLGSQRMKQLLDAAGADYEYVVFDSAPPARRHRRRGPLARRGRHGHWSRKAIASSRSSLERPWRRRMPSMAICWGSSLLGIVLNRGSAILAAPTPTRQNRMPSIRSTEHVRRLTHPRGVDTGETGTDTSTGTGTDTRSTTQEIPTSSNMP